MLGIVHRQGDSPGAVEGPNEALPPATAAEASMKVTSLFAGIGGFDLAFENVGVEVTNAVEWDKNCRALLEQKFPKTRIYGDIKEVHGAELGEVDVLVGGFPCQDVSIAGPRDGLSGERSALWYEFVRLIEETRPEWVLAENVAGLLSSGKRRDMGAVLGTLANLGYGFAYRVLDAQFFGVPQRRRRVFIVGHSSGSPRGPAKVLLDSEGVLRDTRARSEAGSVVAALTRSGLGGGGPDDNLAQGGHLLPISLRMRSGKPGGGKGALLREDQSLTLATGNDQTVFQPVAQPYVERDGMLYAVRRLMPIECERLQGFPDGWTEGFADTVRYRMLGNAVAVPVAQWIAHRIKEGCDRTETR